MNLSRQQLAELYSSLLAEHRLLLTEHHALLRTLRSTPAYTHGADGPLYLTEEEEDMKYTGRAPGPKNPFEDLRQDEAVLASLGLDPNIDFQ